MCIDERRQRRSLRALYPAGTLVHAAWDYAIQHVTRERELKGIWPLKTARPINWNGSCVAALWGCLAARAIVMGFELSQIRFFGSLRRVFDFLAITLLSLTLTPIGPPAFAEDAGNDNSTLQQPHPSAEGHPSDESHPSEDSHPATQNAQSQPSPAASTVPDLCGALATAATSNDLPVDFFTRLIWQESRFRPNAISPKGAQGVAQFMPETARLNGLENPFNPLEAIEKSGHLLGDLRNEFGNLGLAAAAYNAGSGRVRDWLGRRRPLPQETRTYVQVVTGRSVEEWTGAPARLLATPSGGVIPCNLPATAMTQGKPVTPAPRPIKPWGVEVVGGPSPVKALDRYHEWQSKYPTILANREPYVVIRGPIGEMGAAHVRVNEDSRPEAEKLCAALKAAGSYCEVWRN